MKYKTLSVSTTDLADFNNMVNGKLEWLAENNLAVVDIKYSTYDRWFSAMIIWKEPIEGKRNAGSMAV
jgi:hypothetical protein